MQGLGPGDPDLRPLDDIRTGRYLLTKAARAFSPCTLASSKGVSVPGLGTVTSSDSSTNATGRFFNHDFEPTDRPTNPLSSAPIPFSPTLTVDPTTAQFTPACAPMYAGNAATFAHYNIDDNHR